jgi:hypothetical protein
MQLPSAIGENWAPPLDIVRFAYIASHDGRDLRSNKCTEGGTGGLRRICKLEVLTDSRFLRVLKRDGGEWRNCQVRAFRARLDESSSQSEDGFGSKGGIESSGDGLGAGSHTDESLVTSLNGDDGTGGSKDVGRVDKGRGSEVSGDTDSLENAGGLDHGVSARQSSIEVVLAGLNGLCAGSSDGGLQSGNVSSFSLTNAHQRLHLARTQTKSHEVCHRELGKSLLVELRLEMFSSQGAADVRL